MQTDGKAFKGIQRKEAFALVKYRELKDNKYQDTQTKNIQDF